MLFNGTHWYLLFANHDISVTNLVFRLFAATAATAAVPAAVDWDLRICDGV